eukprot:9144379-Alexandrium_andersonii.AAC.1
MMREWNAPVQRGPDTSEVNLLDSRVAGIHKQANRLTYVAQGSRPKKPDGWGGRGSRFQLAWQAAMR